MLFTKHIRLFGRVQGVYFRESMRVQATKLGLNGWARNRLDGSVEAVIQGDYVPLMDFLAWAGTGPALAHVERMEVQEGEGDFIGFTLRPTE